MFIEHYTIIQHLMAITINEMFPSITLPTRSSGTLIDQIYCKLKDPKQLAFSCVIGTMISGHYLCVAIMDIFKSQKHQPKFVLYYICKHTIMIQRHFAPLITNCERDFKMCSSILIYVLIRMMIMNCLWWSPSQISSFKNVRFKMYKHRLPLMVFCVPSNTEINCSGKYDPLQMEQTSIHHCR